MTRTTNTDERKHGGMRNCFLEACIPTAPVREIPECHEYGRPDAGICLVSQPEADGALLQNVCVFTVHN